MATPIGNLGDVTFRALEVLRSVPLVAAEDTRHSRRLLAPNGITTHLVSFHARNASDRLPVLLAHLRGGADLALITDAGTPGVSDPGEDLVRAWASEGGTVVPIPGASAVLAAVMASGIAGPQWSFEGFLPRSGRERRERLGRIAADSRASILYEAPGRVAATLADLAAACGGDRAGAVCRELTKLHESIVRGSLAELAAVARSGEIPARGEFALVIGAGRGSAPDPGASPAAGGHAGATAGAHGGTAALAGAGTLAEAAALAEVERLVAAGVARGEAARRVAAATGINRRKLYRTA